MKVLVFGNKGWIGGMMCDILKNNNINFVNSNVRANNKYEVEKELLNIKPTHVMSFIGRTHGVIGEKKYTTIDYLEQKGKIVENVRDNLFSPMVLSILCKKHNISGFPTMILIENGKKVADYDGERDKSGLLAFLEGK